MPPKATTYWGRFASVYDRGTDYVMGRELRKSLVEQLRREEPMGSLLECGCGSGYYTRVLTERSDRVLATDISEEMLATAMVRLRNFRNVSLRRADCTRLPFADECFDTVVLANVLHTIASPSRALREARRVLRPDGLVLVLSYTDYGMAPWDIYWMATRYYATFGPPPPEGMVLFTPLQLASLLKSASLRVLEVRLTGSRTRALYGRARK